MPGLANLLYGPRARALGYSLAPSGLRKHFIGCGYAALRGSQSWLPPAKCGLTVTLFVLALLNNFPMTADFSAWYSGISLAITLFILAIAAFAFHSALGGRKLFREGFLES